ncbi:MAG: hypothetical protein J6A29_04470 [Clostridia bacterium]|nr:hypothetical protein [Clostridia bacterium]
MLVFFIILIILILMCLLIYLSGIKIQINNIEIERRNKIKINDLKINICFMLFNKLQLIKVGINKEKIEKINFNKIKDKIKEKNIKPNKKMMTNGIKTLKVKTESLNIRAKLGLNNAVSMAYLVAVINIVLSIIFAKISNGNKKENYKYVIKPLQTDKLYLKISINCIIKIKIANIINMIIMNRSEEKNERTSNRSFNGNYHDQYTRYGRCKHYYRSTN